MENLEKEDRIIAPIYKRLKLRDNLFLYKLIDFIVDAKYNDLDDTIFYSKKNRKLYAMDDMNYNATDDKYCYGSFFRESEIALSYGIEDEKEAVNRYMTDVKSILKFCFFDIEEEYLKIVDLDIESMLNIPLSPDNWQFYLNYDSASNEGMCSIPLTSVQSISDHLKLEKYAEIEHFLEIILVSNDKIKELTHGDNATNLPVATAQLSGLSNQDELDSLIGLDNIKKEIRRLKNYLLYLEKTKGVVNIDNLNLNMALYGNPGTGKTTVARIIAKMLYDLGYAKSDKFAETTARDFIAAHVGQTAIKTRDILNANKGGIIFIDEAYIFNSSNEGNSCYAEEAIVEILKELEKKETIFIFAGYLNEMKNFVEMNPGLKSRIGYHLEFHDYSLDELYQIFEYKINKYGLKIGEGLEDRIKAIFATYRTKDKFSNGRFVDNLIQKIVVNHADRLSDVTDIEVLTTIETGDINDEDIKEIASNDKKKIRGFGE